MKPHYNEESPVAKNCDGAQQSHRATTHSGRPAGFCPSFQKVSPWRPEHGSCTARPSVTHCSGRMPMRQLAAQPSRPARRPSQPIPRMWRQRMDGTSATKPCATAAGYRQLPAAARGCDTYNPSGLGVADGGVPRQDAVALQALVPVAGRLVHRRHRAWQVDWKQRRQGTMAPWQGLLLFLRRKCKFV